MPSASTSSRSTRSVAATRRRPPNCSASAAIPSTGSRGSSASPEACPGVVAGRRESRHRPGVPAFASFCDPWLGCADNAGTKVALWLSTGRTRCSGDLARHNVRASPLSQAKRPKTKAGAGQHQPGGPSKWTVEDARRQRQGDAGCPIPGHFVSDYRAQGLVFLLFSQQSR